tara:strand:+ start:647 stop:1012 length:366 start_codon:yes stop_codon:yes gene_type:complete
MVSVKKTSFTLAATSPVLFFFCKHPKRKVAANKTIILLYILRVKCSKKSNYTRNKLIKYLAVFSDADILDTDTEIIISPSFSFILEEGFFADIFSFIDLTEEKGKKEQSTTEQRELVIFSI